jgi:membrane fusion protein (multidrug efflux system)
LVRRHFFLFAALAALVLMVAAAGWRITTAQGAEAGPGGAAGPPGARAGGPPGGGGRGGPGGGRPTTVEVASVQSRLFSDRIDALGVAKSNRSVTITSNTTEQITRVRFTSGQTVRQGQVLVEFEAAEQAAGIIQAQAAVRQAERDLARQRTLFQKGFVAQARLDDAQAAVDTARAQLSAQRAVAGDRTIRAPFSGVIGLSDAAAGQLVSPGTEVATLDDLSSINVDFQVPERYLNVLRPGVAIEARADAFPDQAIAGRIARIDTRVDSATRAITARATFANPGQRIKPGQLMRIAVVQGQRMGAAAPEAAVQFEGESAFVYRIAAQGEGSTAQRVDVRTGAREAGLVEITEGLKVGERIVANGLNRVQPNQPLIIAGAARPAAARAPGGAPPA